MRKSGKEKKIFPILIAEDDPDDTLMIREAFEENLILNNLYFVDDGEQLMDYLLRRKKYTNTKNYPTPGMILLDLNMPKKDGREALNELKSNTLLRRIPVIILTTSKAEEDIIKSYDLGVSGFITKPVTFIDLVRFIKIMGKYWFEIVELPAQE